MLALRLSKDFEDRLEFMAKKTGRTKSFFARQAIEEKMEELECIYLLERAYTESDGTTLSLEEVKKLWEIDEA